MKKNIDIIFCSIPYSDLDHIYSAPAILKGIVKQAKFTAKTIDFGILLLKLCNRNLTLFHNIQNYFISDFKGTEEEEKIFNLWQQEILLFFKNNPSKFIAFSAISYMQHKTIIMLIAFLKKNKINSKFVIGGRGTKASPWSILNLGQEHDNQTFGDYCLTKNIADYVIIGDGEEAIFDILGGGKKVKKIVYENNEDWLYYPTPDYDDYEFDQYLFEKKTDIAFPITGSRGCVRDCDFCDVRYHFGKYQYRSGTAIANEILQINKRHGFNKFMFTDNLINGNLKSLKEFCEILAEHNKNYPENKIRWTGQWICRPPHQMPESLYSLIAQSGAESLTIGAESGSNAVLNHINKKTNVEALYQELDMFKKYNLRAFLLTFTGHWDESWENFIEHCRMFINLLPHVRSTTITAISLGIPAMILEGTPAKEKVSDGIIIQAPIFKEYLFYNKRNPNTLQERVYRRLILSLLAKKLNLPIAEEDNYLFRIFYKMEPFINEIKEFQKIYLVDGEKARHYFYEFDEFYEKLTEEKQINLELETESSGVNGNPTLSLYINEENYYNEVMKDGRKTISISKKLDKRKKIKIDVCMQGKKNFDTIVHNGNIIKDKFVKINSFKINNYDLFEDYDFCKKYIKYTDKNNISKEFTKGFWENSKMSLEIDLPFVNFYNSRTTKQINLLDSKLSVRELIKKFDLSKLIEILQSLE